MMIGKILRFGRRQLHTIVSREIIKPSSPTPSHLQTYNLSQHDQWHKHDYMPLILFYPNNETCNLTPDDKAREMKKALSLSLTQYYPFAGRLHTPTAPYIDCKDEGVVFVEAKNDKRLNMFQHVSEEDDNVTQLFVDGMVWQNSPQRASLVGVQLNHFACGGMAVAVSMSHRIGDGSSLGSFVSHWASVARYGSTDHNEVRPLNPQFVHSQDTTNFLPPEIAVLDTNRVNAVTRKFVFPNSKLTDLKNTVRKLEGGGSTLAVNNPTRVEVLTSLLYKTAVAAANPRSSSFKPSFLIIPVNIRNKFVPKLPQTTLGNFSAGMLVTTQHESETSLSVVVSEIKKQKKELERMQSLQLARQKIDSIQRTLGNITFCCSSLCGHLYNKINFGWGNPAATCVTFRSSNHIGSVLMDAPNGDGIEAWVTLETEHMERFQNDKNMLSFCDQY